MRFGTTMQEKLKFDDVDDLDTPREIVVVVYKWEVTEA